MIFYINNRVYRLKISWATVLLKDAVAVSKCKIDDKKFKALIETDSISYDQETMNYMIEAIACFSDCPVEVLRQTDDVSIVVLFDTIKYMIKQLYFLDLESYEPQGIDTFVFKGKTYYMPDVLELDEQAILAFKEPAKNITEAMGLMQNIAEMKNEGIEKVKYLCAIYLKETPNEKYDIEKINARAKAFEDLPMWMVWEIFFFTYFCLAKSINAILVRSFEKKGRQRVMDIIRGSWQLLRVGLLVTWLRLKSNLYGKFATYSNTKR